MQTSFSLTVRGKTLRGIAHLPEKENCPCLVLCHGLTGCAHERPLMAIAKELEKNGVVCLRHDCIGSGESDGLPEEATTSTEAEDTSAVMEYARTLPQVDPEKILVGGHSLGALAAVMAAEKANAAGLVLLAMVLLRQVCELSGRLPGYLEALPRWTELVRGRAQQLCAACPEGLRSWLEALLDGLSAQLAELLESMGQRCLRAVTAAAAALPQAVLFCATTLLAVLFTAGSYPRIRAFLRRQLPEDRLRQARGVKADLLATLGKWCKAQCILLGVTFCELLTGLLLMRQGYALLLAALIAVIDALPVFGTGTVLVPWGALCLLTGNVPKGLGLLALYGVISLVRSVLEPKIMAAQVDLSPLAALAAMYVGFCAFGVAGMVLCPMALLFVKQLHDSGWLRLWK